MNVQYLTALLKLIQWYVLVELKKLPGLINAHSVVSRCHLNQSAQHLFGWHTEQVLLKGNDYEGYPFLGKLYIVLNCI